MQAPDFIPIGSVVTIKGSEKKLMVISRAVSVPQEKEQRYYDYGGCLWPEGLLYDKGFYFNHEGIDEVIFKGFENEEEAHVHALLIEGVSGVDMPKGNPAPLDVVQEANGGE